MWHLFHCLNHHVKFEKILHEEFHLCMYSQKKNVLILRQVNVEK